MPLYEYRCNTCGKTFEIMQKFSDTPLTVHEGCGGEVERLLSAPAIQFKGSGWYITDYARKNGKPAPGDSSKARSSDKGTKTETKPVSTSSPKKI